jgi:hypothetical protein
MLTGAAAAEALRADAAPTECWTMPTRERRARELLHGIGLMERCLCATESTGHQRRKWKRQIAASQRALEALYARGLDRQFLFIPTA